MNTFENLDPIEIMTDIHVKMVKEETERFAKQRYASIGLPLYFEQQKRETQRILTRIYQKYGW